MTDHISPIRIVLANEDSASRQDLRRVIGSEPSLHIVGEASDCRRALLLTRQLRADVLLIDSAVFQPSDLTELNASGDNVALVRFVVMVPEIEKAQLIEAFRYGAHGIVLKSSSSRVLGSSLRSVMAGQYWLESESLAVLVEALKDSLAQVNSAKSPKDYGLTRREVEIMTKIANGSSNREVGEKFCISERTVKHHLTNIFTKVGVSSRLQLALFAVNHQFMNGTGSSLSMRVMQTEDEAKTGAM